MAFKILKLRRGLKAALPTLQEGELAFCTDTKELFIGTSSGNQLVQKGELDKKVNAVNGKGLSTNDYTTAEKEKLEGIAVGATKVIVDNALSATSINAVQNKIVKAALDGKAEANTLAAHTGNSEIHITSAERTAWNNAKSVTDNVIKTWGTFTLSASSWSTESGTGYLKQTVAVSGMAATHNPAMIPVFTSLALAKDEKKGFGLIIDATTTAGYVTVRCSEAPTVALKFKLVGV